MADEPRPVIALSQRTLFETSANASPAAARPNGAFIAKPLTVSGVADAIARLAPA